MDCINILRGIGKSKTMKFDIEKVMTKFCLAEIHKGKQVQYANCAEEGNLSCAEVESHQYGIIPHIPLWLERFICLVVGTSGEGKTLIVSQLLKQYLKCFDNDVFYICPTAISKDISLNNVAKHINQIFPTEINYASTKKNAEHTVDSHNVEFFENSLVVFDDIDGCEHSKEANRLLNTLLVTGRKFGVSIIFISHENTHAKFSTFDKEINMYITKPSNLKNNRLITNYLQLDISSILPFVDMNDAYICINKVYNYAITDRKILSIVHE